MQSILSTITRSVKDPSAAASGPAGAAEPQPRPSCVPTAFALGWQMATLYRGSGDDSDGSDGPGAPDALSELGSLPIEQATELGLDQVDKALRELDTELGASRLPGDLTQRLRTQLGQPNVTESSIRQGIVDLHQRLLVCLTAADFRAGKAYRVGQALCDMCDGSRDESSFAGSFGDGGVAAAKSGLADLKSAFPAHAGQAVLASLQAWAEWARLPRIDGHPLDWDHDGSRVRFALHRQGQRWRALLSGEKAAQDMLAPEDYVQAAERLFVRARGLVGQFVRRSWPWLVGAGVVIVLAIAVIAVTGTAAGAIAGVSAVLTTVGITWKGASTALGSAATRLEAPLWGAEVDAAVFFAITYPGAPWLLATSSMAGAANAAAPRRVRRIDARAAAAVARASAAPLPAELAATDTMVLNSAALLARFQPQLLYDSQEAYFCDSAAELTDNPNDTLARAPADDTAGAVIARAGASPALGLEFLGPRDYADGQAVLPKDRLGIAGSDYRDQYVALRMARPDLRNRMYGHAVRDSQHRLWLQYWFFYFYNDYHLAANFGLHEGDWEMIQLRIVEGPDPQPDIALYAQHNYAELRDWTDVPRQRRRPDTPVVYPGRGSHASYFDSGVHATDFWYDIVDGRRPAPPIALTVIDDSQPSWGHWPGQWGDTEPRIPGLESESPQSPCAHAQWRDPLLLLRDAKTHARAPAGDAPKVQVTRTGGDLVVSYDFTQDTGALPDRLIVGVNSVDEEGVPPRTYTVEITGERKGGRRLPTLPPITDTYRYDVTVSVSRQDGRPSATRLVYLATNQSSSTSLLSRIGFLLSQIGVLVARIRGG